MKKHKTFNQEIRTKLISNPKYFLSFKLKQIKVQTTQLSTENKLGGWYINKNFITILK